MADANNIIQQVQRGGNPRIIAIGATNAFTKAGVEAGRTIKDELTRKFFKALNLNLIPATRLETANLHLARTAQNAVTQGWKATLPAKSPDYRRGPDPKKNRLSQLLGPALASSSMLAGTTNRTISFINIQTLNTEARHWYRVNYGAYGPKVNLKRPKAFPVKVGGKTLFELHDPHRPAPNSWLPRGYIAEGRHYFEPKKGPADVHGGGSRSAVFTDLGFASLATNFGPTYRAMFISYIDEAGVKAKLRKAGLRVRVTITDRNATVS